MSVAAHDRAWQFRHEALVYHGDEEFTKRIAPFVADGLDHDEAVLVATTPEKISMVRDALGGLASRATFIDMTDVGRNPARILPVWQRFVDEHVTRGQSARGVGEPVWAGRTGEEIDECRRHEALLNHAFDPGPAWWLVCPYDAQTLPRDVVQGVARTHPVVVNGETAVGSDHFLDGSLVEVFAGELPDLGNHGHEISFVGPVLRPVREFVARQAIEAGLDDVRAGDLVLAAGELAANSVRHGGGGGTLRAWRLPTRLVCEVSDRGRLDDPLAGRRVPSLEQVDGRGLWLANQLCDLVQVRSSESGTTVRLHIELA